VFLIDTSGSMQDEDKLPLLKKSFGKLVNNLREQDRVSIVVYAGSAGLVLPSTSGANKAAIMEALDQLDAGGSTNGGQGIELAYKVARDNMIKGGINRVVLATDGDFNVGTVSQNALETMVSDQRENGVSLTTLGFGQGNYNDELSERLADVGNGNHAYIDSLREAEKVLSTELGSTLQTIAKDVKIQIEFNPAVVAEYRLIGYENRMLRREDFNNDKIDAGEIGAGHDVTALYEITLVNAKNRSVDPLRFEVKTPAQSKQTELAWLKMRYKQPEGSKSQLIEQPIRSSTQSTQRLYWAASVAAYADRLRGGTHMGEFGWNDIAALAQKSRSKNDPFGNQAEFLELISKAQSVVKAQGNEAVSMSE
jgi:Ca-activated chloride channel homolog